ncbi:MAG: radical SAM protein [Candidatus Marinimicrobia bacterium]|nr:radical SAM protein [Candidatus Neomarinimicrobiota bacterium]
MAKYISAKQILLPAKGAGTGSNIFGIRYSMNCYRGCQHGCIYCDTRSDCYRVRSFNDVEVKINAVDLLRKELAAKRTKGTVGTGSMHDPYMPLEIQEKLTRHTLEVLSDFHFPVHIMTKSNLVLRDLDVLKQLSNVYAAVTFTITTVRNDLSLLLEPNAPESSQRFQAMKALASKGILTGISMMPVLPWITDHWSHIRLLVEKATDYGASYILNAGMGMTLRQGQREFFYRKLDNKFPGMRQKYEKAYGNNYYAYVEKGEEISGRFHALCDKLGIAVKIPTYEETLPIQRTLF